MVDKIARFKPGFVTIEIGTTGVDVPCVTVGEIAKTVL